MTICTNMTNQRGGEAPPHTHTHTKYLPSYYLKMMLISLSGESVIKNISRIA